MINLNRPDKEIVAAIKEAVISGDDESLVTIAEHSRAGFRSWQASTGPRKGDSLHALLTKSIISLQKIRNDVPDFDSVVKNLWEVDDANNPSIMDINGIHRFVVWRDSEGEYQKTSFRLIKKRIDRILKKLGLSTKA